MAGSTEKELSLVLKAYDKGMKVGLKKAAAELKKLDKNTKTADKSTKSANKRMKT